MTGMAGAPSQANALALAAIAGITGQSEASAIEMFDAAKRSAIDETLPSVEEIQRAIDRLCTRIGLAPALMHDERDHHIRGLRDLPSDDFVDLTRGDLAAWDQLLRTTPEKVPTVQCEPVPLQGMPEHQKAMWLTLLNYEDSDPPPWVLVGGQMTALHLAEHGRTEHRPTDDGDLVVGVWTRRDALRTTAIYLTSNGFTEQRTSDGYGYRFVRGKTSIDVMIPEGLERQKRYPTTGSGRPGLQADGGNQALTRAERLPIRLGDQNGYVRRPTLLGSIVTKARAWVVDGREPERHAQDLIALAEVALQDPRGILSQTRPDDRRAVRAAMRHLPIEHRLWRRTGEGLDAHTLLTRLAG